MERNRKKNRNRQAVISEKRRHIRSHFFGQPCECARLSVHARVSVCGLKVQV